MRPVIFGTLLICVICASCGISKPKEYSFFVAGHVYGSTLRKAPGLHPPFVDDFNYIRNYKDMRFGVFTGDIVYHSRDSFWNAVDREIELLDLKVHFAPGNHDEGHKSPYKERYGDTFYSFEHESDLCIVLNPGLGGWNIWKDQMAFLKQQLKSAKKYNNIFLFFHQVLWWTPDNEYKNFRPNSLDGRTPTTNFWSEVMPLLSDTGCQVFCFAGDVGASGRSEAFFRDRRKNVHFIASGMGNRVRDNYLIVSVDEKKNVQIFVRWLQQKNLVKVIWNSDAEN